MLISGVVGKKCHKGYEIQICESGAGSYLGTKDETGAPNCRCSDYFNKGEIDVEDRGYAIEVQWCNEGKGCLNK